MTTSRDAALRAVALGALLAGTLDLGAAVLLNLHLGPARPPSRAAGRSPRSAP
jgi:hypothetical protein